MNTIIASAKADFLRKSRRESFLIMLLFMSILTMVFFPQASASYQTIVFGEYRGLYNSAWIGSTLAILNVTFFPLILFYYLRGAIQQDSESQCMELFAATKLNKFNYVLGKAASLFAISLCIMCWVILVAVLMQLWIGEDRSVDIGAIVLPQIIHVVPMLMFISALCVLFDSVGFLQRGIGNVIYFFLATIVMIALSFEYSGVNAVIDQMKDNVQQAHGIVIDGITVGISAKNEATALKTFIWEGATYQYSIFYKALSTMGASALLIVVASIVFDFKKQINNGQSKRKHSAIETFFKKLLQPINRILLVMSTKSVLLNMIRQELLIIIGGKSIYLYLCLLLLVILQIVMPLSLLMQAVLPATLLLNALMISDLGQREHASNTSELLINAPYLMKIQFPAMYLAAFFVFIFSTFPALARITITGDMFALSLLLFGYLSIIALAICLGALTKTTKAFEIIFVAIWYMGPLSRFTYLDFIGVNVELSKALGTHWIFLIIASVLIGLSVFLRRRGFVLR